MARTLGLMLVVAVLAGCQSPHVIGPGDPQFSTVGFLKEHDAASLSSSVLVAEGGKVVRTDGREILPYHNQRVWDYVLKYAAGGNDCPQGQFDSDCAHFQSHALAAAGIRVSAPSAACVKGMSMRVKDLAMAFDNASRRYANVTKFSDYHQARRGDFCFLPKIEGGSNDHMMLLGDTPDLEGAIVWSHTNNRMGTHAPFDPVRCVFYRIEDR